MTVQEQIAARYVPRAHTESAWALWLAYLDPFERRVVTNPCTDRELKWHDDYIRGTVTLQEFEERINQILGQ